MTFKCLSTLGMGVLSVTVLLLLGGCSQQLKGERHLDVRHKPISENTLSSDEIVDFFEKGDTSLSMYLESSPWGEDVQVKITSAYYAASGRQCRELLIDGNVRGHSVAAVCRVGHGLWETIRPVTKSLPLSAQRDR